MDSLLLPDVLVRNDILSIASVLNNDAAPGYVTIQLVAALCFAVIGWQELVKRRRTAFSCIHCVIANTPDDQFSQHATDIGSSIAEANKTEEKKAWPKLGENIVNPK